MNTKKVAVLTKYFHPVVAGIETNIAQTYSVLAKKGWDISIHTSKDTYVKQEVLPDFENHMGLKILRYKFYGDLLGYFPKIKFSDIDILSLHNFNVYYLWIILYVFIWNTFKKKKVIIALIPHGGFIPEWRVFGKNEAFFKSLYHKTIGTFLINKVIDGVRAVSEWEKKEMVKMGVNKNKITTITNGLEDEAFLEVEKFAGKSIKDKVQNYGNYIIQIGRIYPIKNYETTIKAMKHLPKHINYVIVGSVADKKYFKKLQKLIKSLNLENRVFFHGLVYGVDKYYLIKKSLMMVHMAIWESFCNVIHEALSQGKVCIVANNTALPYIIKDGENGFCVDTFDSRALARKINYVYENKDLDVINSMEKRNKNIKRNESWEYVAGEMKDWFLNL